LRADEVHDQENDADRGRDEHDREEKPEHDADDDQGSCSREHGQNVPAPIRPETLEIQYD
jgi:hypothetical protein